MNTRKNNSKSNEVGYMLVEKKADELLNDEDSYVYRWGHSLVAVPRNDDVTYGAEYLDSLLMVGGVHRALTSKEDGKDQVLVKNMPTLMINSDLTNVEIIAKSGVIPPIFGHSCKYIRGYYLVMCIGGFDTASDIFLPRSVYGVFIFDIQYAAWRSLVIENLKYDNGMIVPEYGVAESSMEIIRLSANMAPIIVVVGGRSQCYNCYSNYKDITRQRARGYIRYSTKTQGIKILNVLFEPSGGLYGHCTVADGNTIYVLFGGLPMQGPGPIIRRFQVLPSRDGYGYYTTTFDNIMSSNPMPIARIYPTCFIYGKQIYIFGGLELTQNGGGSSASVALQDSWKFDIQTLKWSRLKENTRVGPGPRWRAANTVMATIQDSNNNRYVRQFNSMYDNNNDNIGITGMILHGGLTSGIFKEDPKFYFLRSAVTGGWKGISPENDNIKNITIPEQQKSSGKLSIYIQIVIILFSLLLLGLLCYTIRYLFLKLKKHKNKAKKTKSISNSVIGSITDNEKTTIPRTSIASLFSKSSSFEKIPSILSKNIPSIIASKQKTRSPNNAAKKNTGLTVRSFSSKSSFPKKKRSSSVSWEKEEVKNNFPDVPAELLTNTSIIPKSLTGSSCISSNPENIDLSKPYIAIQSFNAQRYDEVSLTRGDLCTMRLVFKDNWAVGMNLTLRKTGIIPVACLQIEPNAEKMMNETVTNKFQESSESDGIACYVSLEYQRSLKELDQLLESRSITIDKYLSRRMNIFNKTGE